MLFTFTWVRRQFFMSFFFNDTATTEIYTLSLHDALPISRYLGADDLGVGQFRQRDLARVPRAAGDLQRPVHAADLLDRKSTRLNSSHANISYAVFCLKKKS